MMKAVKILYGQTITDIAVQELGDAERAMEIASLNDMSLTDELTAGEMINVPDPDISKRSLVNLFTDDAKKPASADVSGVTEPVMEGIGYWYIENDFAVQ